MGLHTDPVPPGDDCIACWDAGETPSYIYVIFDGVLKGDVPGAQQPPNGRIFKCDQNVGDPCLFEFNPVGAGWRVQLRRTVAPERWHVSLNFSGLAHFTGVNAGCPSEHDIWTNILWSPIWWAGYNGVATIFWMEEALELMELMGIPIEPDTFMEFFVKDESKPVYKFCNQRFSINTKAEITP